MSARPDLVPALPTARPRSHSRPSLVEERRGRTYVPRVILRRPLRPGDRAVATGAGIAAALAAGLATFYLTTLWRARDPR